MYVAQCAGGYPMPLKAGKFEVYGVRATIKDPTAAARLTLLDDETIVDGSKVGNIYPPDTYMTKKTIIMDERTVANTVGNIEMMFPEAIKTRQGISVAGMTNILGGSTMLYVR